jgi:glycosyltransferase involved in cell wall biosynthesis
MNYGHGRLWVEVLKRLSRRVQLDLIEPRYLPHRVTPLRRPDVWLVNGHSAPPLEVDGPAVAVFHEISWHRADLRDQLLPEWADAHDQAARQCMAVATRVLVPSRVSAGEVIAAFGADPSVVDLVPYGVDISRFRPDQPGGGRLLSKVAGRPVDDYVLYVGSLLPRKNLGALRAAMTSLLREGRTESLVIVGSQSPDRADAADLQRAAAAPLDGFAHRVVHMAAPIPQRHMVSLMGGARAFCVPSLYEGFGLVALEAMACAAPVVVSSGGSLPEVVGDAGVIVEPTPNGIEAGLRCVLTDQRTQDRLRSAARARAESMTWDHTVDGWVESLMRAADR